MFRSLVSRLLNKPSQAANDPPPTPPAESASRRRPRQRRPSSRANDAQAQEITASVKASGTNGSRSARPEAVETTVSAEPSGRGPRRRRGGNGRRDIEQTPSETRPLSQARPMGDAVRRPSFRDATTESPKIAAPVARPPKERSRPAARPTGANVLGPTLLATSLSGR